jgi:hypothetical protein
MSTPLELRNWRKGAQVRGVVFVFCFLIVAVSSAFMMSMRHFIVVQRSLRLLFNGMVKALSEWKVG